MQRRGSTPEWQRICRLAPMPARGYRWRCQAIRFAKPPVPAARLSRLWGASCDGPFVCRLGSGLRFSRIIRPIVVPVFLLARHDAEVATLTAKARNDRFRLDMAPRCELLSALSHDF